MDFRFGRFLRCGLLALSVPLVGWQFGYPSGNVRAADEGVPFMSIASRQSMRYGGTMPHGFVIPMDAAGQPLLDRSRQPQPQPRPQAQFESEPWPQAQPQPRPQAQAQFQPHPQAQFQPQLQPLPRPQAQTQFQPHPQAQFQPQPQTQLQPLPRPQAQAQFQPHPQAQFQPQPQPEVELQHKGDAPLPNVARADASPTRVRPHRRPASSILVARRAEEHIRYALVLAERGAAYSAQAEFIQVLRLVSQTLDQENGTQVYGRAMVAGLRALREADDFASRSSDPADVVNLAHCITAHRTPVLKGVDTTEITPMDALQEYHTFASQQLASAGGREPAASMALYGLARLQSVLDVGSGPRRSTAETNAIALHQAALAVDQHNYMAANELAVLLARYGQMESAQMLLQHSLSICESSETWHNLAVLYQERGASKAARWARRRGQIYAASQSARHGRTLGGSPESTVYWVDAATLARSSGVDEAIGPAVPSAPLAHEQYASPWPRENTTDTAGSDLPPVSSGLERFKAFIGLGEPPKTSQTQYAQPRR